MNEIKFKVKEVDVYNNYFIIEPNNYSSTSSENFVTVNTNREFDPTTTNTSYIKWIVKNPSLGLFGSYQHSQAIVDAIKINDFYNNFF